MRHLASQEPPGTLLGRHLDSSSILHRCCIDFGIDFATTLHRHFLSKSRQDKQSFPKSLGPAECALALSAAPLRGGPRRVRPLCHNSPNIISQISYIKFPWQIFKTPFSDPEPSPFPLPPTPRTPPGHLPDTSRTALWPCFLNFLQTFCRSKIHQKLDSSKNLPKSQKSHP